MAEAHKPARSPSRAPAGHLRISLRNVRQLLNSMDPSPFYDRDLDENAERFLVSWAQETPPEERLKLMLHL